MRMSHLCLSQQVTPFEIEQPAVLLNDIALINFALTLRA